MADVTTQNPSIILEKTNIEVPLMVGEIPGKNGELPPDDMFAGWVVQPPVEPKRAIQAVLSSGDTAATMHAVAEGCAGVSYTIVPRFKDPDIDLSTREGWPAGASQEYDQLQVFMQAAFIGQPGVKSLRAGMYEKEHDRVILGWGGVVVHREPVPSDDGQPPRPMALGKFEACGGRFTRPDRTPTMVPVPIALDDGRVVWIEQPVFFRRIRWTGHNNRVTWYKQYGDWRPMDARSGRYSKGSRFKPSGEPFVLGSYTRGRLPDEAVAATEVMHWETSFPGVYPYGISGWHSELSAVDASSEHVKLLLAYLKSGLHSVTIAAANRSFESTAAGAALEKIDKLGRGREGMGGLVLIELAPSDSKNSGNLMGQQTGDRGRIIFHEMSTKLPAEIMSGTTSDGLAKRISNAERIPGLLLGRSESYNFATAAAAWAVVNRLRFNPHHESTVSFLDRLIIEMGITRWRIKILSPEWDQEEPLAGLTSVVGQLGGVSVNRAAGLLGRVLEVEIPKVEQWWGDLPVAIVMRILESQNPLATMELLGLDTAGLEMPVIPEVKAAVERIDVALKSRTRAST